MTSRLGIALAQNEEFAEAYGRLESWALQRADEIKALDGQGSRQFPERTAREDGKPHNWCGACVPGCICCDLPWNHAVWKEQQMQEG